MSHALSESAFNLLPHKTNATILSVPRAFVFKFYRKIHYLTREFRVKLDAKTDIARIAKR